MLDDRAFAVVVALISIAGGYLLGGRLGAVICLLLAAVVVVVLWTPLRGWLGIPKPGGSSRRTGYRGHPGSTATFRRTRFGSGLDTDIDNEGDIDVDDSDIE
jgi:hypothetical protein